MVEQDELDLPGKLLLSGFDLLGNLFNLWGFPIAFFNFF